MSARVRISLLSLLAIVAIPSLLFASSHRRQCTCVKAAASGTARPLSDSVFRRLWFDSYPIVAVMTMLRVDSSNVRAWIKGGMLGAEPNRLAWFRVEQRWTAFDVDSVAMVWSDDHTESCGMPDYKVGAQYVVSGVQLPGGVISSASSCGEKPDPLDVETRSGRDMLRRLGAGSGVRSTRPPPNP